MADIQLLNMDCMEYMAGCKDKAFELAIVDPPYGIHDKLLRRGNVSNFAILYRNNQWDKQRPNKTYFNELQRISVNQVICGGNYFADLLPASRGWAVWDKMKDNMTVVNNELIWTSFDMGTKMFRRQDGMDKGIMNQERNNIHPTQKPIALYKWLLKTYAKPGDRIFDSHGGSFSSAIACQQMGFDFVGCELDKDYYEMAVARFHKQTRQTEMFDYQPLQPASQQLTMTL
jgi:site-specific DNA-methyltransferase (adenine-specific)